MKIARLEIEQQSAQLNIRVQNAQLHMEQPDRRMEIDQKLPDMAVTRSDGEVVLDLTAFKSNLGLKNFDELNREAAEQARTDALQAIRQTVNNAFFVGDPTKGPRRLAGRIRNEMLQPWRPAPKSDPVPDGDVGMDGVPGTLQIKWDTGDLNIEWNGDAFPDIYVEPPCSVEISLMQRPYVKISVVMDSIPSPAGRQVNTQV